MGRFWNSAMHPRDSNGRFAKKLSVGVRVSTRSVSVTVGKRVPLVPGKVNLYVGALARVERANRNNGPLDRAIDGIKNSVVNSFPEGKFRNIASSLAQQGSVNTGSTLITGSTGFRGTPTIRASTRVGGAPVARPTGTSLTPAGRPSKRVARAPRQPRARKVAS